MTLGTQGLCAENKILELVEIRGKAKKERFNETLFLANLEMVIYCIDNVNFLM